MAPYEGTQKNIHLTNLPVGFVQGPYILKSGAFTAYHDRAIPPIRATALWLSYQGGKISIARTGVDPDSQYEASEEIQEVPVDLNVVFDGLLESQGN